MTSSTQSKAQRRAEPNRGRPSGGPPNGGPSESEDRALRRRRRGHCGGRRGHCGGDRRHIGPPAGRPVSLRRENGGHPGIHAHGGRSGDPPGPRASPSPRDQPGHPGQRRDRADGRRRPVPGRRADGHARPHPPDHLRERQGQGDPLRHRHPRLPGGRSHAARARSSQTGSCFYWLHVHANDGDHPHRVAQHDADLHTWASSSPSGGSP